MIEKKPSPFRPLIEVVKAYSLVRLVAAAQCFRCWARKVSSTEQCTSVWAWVAPEFARSGTTAPRTARAWRWP